MNDQPMPVNNEQFSETLLAHPEVEVESQTLDNKHFLIFEFRNHFSIAAAEAAVACWVANDQKHQRKAIHIWNCKRMSGFDMGAKKIWMNQMKASGDQIDRIILVSEMVLIRGAARLMSKFSKHRLDVYKSFSQMGEKEKIGWERLSASTI